MKNKCNGIPFGRGSSNGMICGNCNQPIRRMENGQAEHVPSTQVEFESEQTRLLEALRKIDDAHEASQSRGDIVRAGLLRHARHALWDAIREAKK